MARPISYRIATEALSKFPKQELRPDYQIQDVLKKTLEARFANYNPSKEAEELFRARSLQMLQENRFMDRYKLSGRMLEPNSQPTYFADLVREIEEAPKRTWFERLGKKLSGMVRLQ
ncbi:uncharacterized protein F5Z01DRAFT_676380 [Emericellopsis atlantica]|uniref:Uncharacterized protein n=1 Tax=Emericellopsis atlantica TaxID=2614577 RepID=A0A9P7ZHZ6_9HYPO|nr:uncharacterized protein F5Z01DRAFT_676380 [Emericellopsis atlantica]KAG9252142.1 hypothetical protein F5Z01DRAFT_676380 [Emericellopsis atlantica]